MKQGQRASGSIRRVWRMATLASALTFGMAAQAVEVGDPAPDFALPGSDGEIYRLADLRGRHVVIAFFPKAFTGG